MRLLALLLVALPLLGAGTAQEEGERLEQIRLELDEQRRALKDMDSQQRSVVDSLGLLDESMARLMEEIARVQSEFDGIQARIHDLELKAGLDEKALVDARARLQARLRALYVAGEGGLARALLGAEGFEELAIRRRFLQELAEQDGKLVERVLRIEESVRDRREELRRAAQEAAQMSASLEAQRALLSTARVERQEAITRLGNEKELVRRRAKELEQRRAELSAFLLKLVEEENRRVLSAPRRGKGILKTGLSWPVQGSVIRRYGVIKEKDTGAEMVCNGIELRAELGTPVVASADGRVAHVGWMRGFGRVVILDHGEGHHTISAHLSDASVRGGDEVTKNQVIGFVGDTESANGALLYFELRENGRPIDPARYFR